MAKVRWRLLGQAVLYVAAGLNHFWHPAFYRQIMPDHYSSPNALVAWSGAAEVLGGVGLLVPTTRRLAGGGLAAMLLVFLDVHIFMLRHADRYAGIPRWALWGRSPLQAVLILWALRYTRRENPEA